MVDDGCGCLWHVFESIFEAFSHWAMHSRWLLYLIVVGILAAGLYLLFATSHLWWGISLTAAAMFCFVAIVTSVTDPRQ